MRPPSPSRVASAAGMGMGTRSSLSPLFPIILTLLLALLVGSVLATVAGYLALLYLQVGIAIVLITLSGIAWRLTTGVHPTWRSLLGSIGPSATGQTVAECSRCHGLPTALLHHPPPGYTPTPISGGGPAPPIPVSCLMDVGPPLPPPPHHPMTVPPLPPPPGGVGRRNGRNSGAAGAVGTVPPYARHHGMLYPEFHYRPPPPSYQASMQEYRLRLLLLDRAGSSGVGGGGGMVGSAMAHHHHHHHQHPHQTHAHHSTAHISCSPGGLQIIIPPYPPVTPPPTYRSVSSVAGTLPRPVAQDAVADASPTVSSPTVGVSAEDCDTNQCTPRSSGVETSRTQSVPLDANTISTTISTSTPATATATTQTSSHPTATVITSVDRMGTREMSGTTHCISLPFESSQLSLSHAHAHAHPPTLSLPSPPSLQSLDSHAEQHEMSPLPVGRVVVREREQPPGYRTVVNICPPVSVLKSSDKIIKSLVTCDI